MATPLENIDQSDSAEAMHQHTNGRDNVDVFF
jgi:hypothetical protein